MSGNSNQSQPLYPSIPPPEPNPTADWASSSQPDKGDQGSERWAGTQVMGTPAVPTSHPDNKKAALFGGGNGEQAQAHHNNNNYHHPYVQYSPIETSGNPSSPMESILHSFNSWSHKAETLAHNIWHNLKTNSSVTEAAWGKMNLRMKAMSGGGFESLYKQSFATFPNEKLKKTFACYLSTSTGPVAGTLYLSDVHAAFCSDRPLSFYSPSGQQTWSYYKLMVPLNKIGAINPVVMRENKLEKYIQMVTVDGHDFWFMGFVNYEKASMHLTQSISLNFPTSSSIPAPPAVPS